MASYPRDLFCLEEHHQKKKLLFIVFIRCLSIVFVDFLPAKV